MPPPVQTLPQFTPKYFEQILQDMVNFIRTVVPELTDFNIGSRIRTILETAALEDDEQYHQMAAILLLWNLDNLRGRDLDERLLEWNIFRRQGLAATGEVTVVNDNLTTSFLRIAATAGDPELDILSSGGFPSSGFPITVRVGEDTANEEDVDITANNISSGVLTIDGATPLTKNHAANERVSLVDGSAFTASAGTRVRVRSTTTSAEITATTQEDAIIPAGDYDADPVVAIVDTIGAIGNVAPGAIRAFVGGAPFDGAQVYNESAFVGGRDVESDESFRDRGRKKIQSLARATVLAVEQLVLGVEYTGTDSRTWRIFSAVTKEHFGQGCSDWVDLYVWPGAFDFVDERTVSTVVDFTPTGAEDGQKFFLLPHIAVIPGTLILQRKVVGTSTWVTMTQGTDYFFNEGTGWIEIADPGLNAGDYLQALQYRHHTGLIQEAQNVINGKARNPAVYPGVRAAGVKVLVTYPRPKPMPAIRAGIQVTTGFTELEVAPQVEDAITQYLTELRVGEDVILAEMIERAMSVEGMYNIQFSSPTQDVVLFEDQILDLENLDIIVS